MRVNDWLIQATKKLDRSGISTSRLDCLVLLEGTICKDRAWLLANPDTIIYTAQLTKLNKLLSRRVRHEPLAYIRGKTEFYGREFIVSPAVLEPRPESETMIELLLTLPKLSYQVHIADVGTGCGALGITAALEVPCSSVELLDNDPQALKIAKINVDKFTLNISTICSNLLSSSSQDNEVLLCNLPYVPDNFQINTAATHEPKQAIYGGQDGLRVYRNLFKQISKLTNKPLYLLTESLPMQHETMSMIALEIGFQLYKDSDFIQVFRLSRTT